MSGARPLTTRLREALQGIQSILAFESWQNYPQFSTNEGLGRVALLAGLLGLVLGIHLVALALLLLQRFGNSGRPIIPLSDDRSQLLLQWCLYVVLVSCFHLLEFFTTAVYNPSVASSDGFLINHSPAYTAAFLVSPPHRHGYYTPILPLLFNIQFINGLKLFFPNSSPWVNSPSNLPFSPPGIPTPS